MSKDCVHCVHYKDRKHLHGLCEWERNTLPPPVVRLRLLDGSARGAEVYNTAAVGQDCPQFTTPPMDKG